jgi:hypothetical protein
MTREEAVRLMAIYESLGASMGPVFDTRFMSDKEEGDRVLRAHVDLVMFIYETCMRPIIKQYPDLDPDGMTPEAIAAAIAERRAFSDRQFK